MIIDATEKQTLHYLFFQNASILPEPHYPTNIPQYYQIVSSYAQPNYGTILNQYEEVPLKKKGKMVVACPHKEKKHYAKVHSLLEYVHKLLP